MSLLVSAAPVFPAPSREDSRLEQARFFVSGFSRALQSGEREVYLAAFAPEIREEERIRIDGMFRELGMESVSLYPASLQARLPDRYTAFLRVMYENSFSVILELWSLELSFSDGAWLVRERQRIGESKRHFKLAIPGDRAERVRRFQISHQDITLTFENAWLFYDNIPDLDTALIVIGEGRLDFRPSHPRERHQLEMVYDTGALRDSMDYAYLRFSNLFFNQAVTIEKDDSPETSPSESERNKAYSIFSKHYTRSFTVQNSLDGSYLSILPQGDEAVFEFRGRRVGDVTYVYSPFADDAISFYQWKENRLLNLYSPPLDKGEKRLFISFGQKFEVLDYQIELEFDPARQFFAGKAGIQVETKVALLDSLRFNLNPDLEILRITDENRRELFYTQDRLRKVIYIHLLHPPRRWQKFNIEIYYRGVLPPSELLEDTVSAAPQEGTIRLFPYRFDTLLYTRSSYWYPSPADEDYFTARFRLILPPEYSAVSNGRLVERSSLVGLEDVTDVGKMGNSVFVFQTEKPVKYLAFVVGRLRLENQDEEGVPIRYYRSKETRPDHWDLFAESRGILNFYQSIFGPFPYEKLDIVQRFWNTAGGHSPASFIVLNQLPRAASRRIRGRPSGPVDLSKWREYFLAHEIAHQWWGQGITWDSYRDQWLSEGMSQFAAVMYLRNKHGEKDFARILEKFSRGAEKESIWGGITMGSRISHFDFEAFQTIVYNKAALVLNLLRDLLDEDLFYAGIQRFFSRHRYGPASTTEFINVFRDLSGRDLRRFFDPWLNSYLLPDVQVSSSFLPEGEGGTLKLVFVQKGETFVFPCWVEWREGGRTMRRKVIVDDRRVERDLPVSARPSRVRVNPDSAVPGSIRLR